jgi:hypothetical protein
MTTPSAATATPDLTYNNGLSPTQVIYPISSTWTSWDSYFSNTDTTNCPITSCTLYESGCSTALSSPVSIGGSSPWDVTALLNQMNGYSQSMCVSCTNGAQTIQKDNWSVNLIDCENAISNPASAPTASSLTYDAATSSVVIYPISTTWTSWDSFFSNSDTTNCAITSCSLYESDCSTALSSPVSVGASSPWDVAASKNILAGYT